jgi:hypothetical protein
MWYKQVLAQVGGGVNLAGGDNIVSQVATEIDKIKDVDNKPAGLYDELSSILEKMGKTLDEYYSMNQVQQKEIWDLRLGPSIWDRIRKQFPESILTDESKIELQNYLIQSIFKLPAKEFLVFMKEVISGSENGKRLMNGLMSGIDQMFRDQDYQDAINTFNDDLTDVVEDTDNDDLKDFLNGLNIKLSDDGLDDLLGPGIRRPDDDNQ